MEITELAEDFIEQSINCQPTRPGVRSHLTEHDCSGIPILVPDEIASAESITFFATENEIGRFLKPKLARFLLGQVAVLFLNFGRKRTLVLSQLGPDILKSREGLDAAKSVMLGDRLLQVGCHECLDNNSAGGVLLI